MLAFLGFLKRKTFTNFSLPSRTNVVFYVCFFLLRKFWFMMPTSVGEVGGGVGGGDASDQIQASIIL